jgi:hypothetical protein
MNTDMILDTRSCGKFGSLVFTQRGGKTTRAVLTAVSYGIFALSMVDPSLFFKVFLDSRRAESAGAFNLV